MDEARYAVRSRRQRKSPWSESNNARAAKMLSEGGDDSRLHSPTAIRDPSNVEDVVSARRMGRSIVSPA